MKKNDFFQLAGLIDCMSLIRFIYAYLNMYALKFYTRSINT